MSYLYPAGPRRRARQHCSANAPFVHKPNTLDRDRIVVPAGWDSWGKIVVLRDGFDAKAWGDSWERDLSSDAGFETDDEAGARKLYLQDQGPKACPPP